MISTGIYAIRCTENGKVYVGSASISFCQRWCTHRSKLRRGMHDNRYLQASWNRHGESAFEFIVLEECEPHECIAREQYWIDKLESLNRKSGYNHAPAAGGMLGFKFSEESRKKLSDAKKGIKHSDASRRNMAIAAKARGISPETQAKAHAALRGKPIPDEQKARQAAALRGRKHGPERIAKVAAALRGRKHSPEVRANMSAGQMGKQHSEATKAKMSATRKGRTYSEAHRKAISEGHRKRNMRLKAQADGLLPFMGEDQ